MRRIQGMQEKYRPNAPGSAELKTRKSKTSFKNAAYFKLELQQKHTEVLEMCLKMKDNFKLEMISILIGGE